MTREQYTDWLAVARRHTRVAAEAEDLLHDALVAAAGAGRLDVGEEDNRRWLTGVLRNQAALRARSAVRRRRREARAASERRADAAMVASASGVIRLGTMPRSARSVLALALHGLGRDEICACLGITSTAFRQRLVTVRRALAPLPDALRREALALAYARQQARADDLALGLIRRALEVRARAAPGVGTHDPDGHLLAIDF